jgi:hypothetical protein
VAHPGGKVAADWMQAVGTLNSNLWERVKILMPAALYVYVLYDKIRKIE